MGGEGEDDGGKFGKNQSQQMMREGERSIFGSVGKNPGRHMTRKGQEEGPKSAILEGKWQEKGVKWSIGIPK